ncbi:MAG: hypothetical protein MRY63_13640 [Neomegalonema sp.]|nr:hypothetical protein [Neomegalonema sp.]
MQRPSGALADLSRLTRRARNQAAVEALFSFRREALRMGLEAAGREDEAIALRLKTRARSDLLTRKSSGRPPKLAAKPTVLRVGADRSRRRPVALQLAETAQLNRLDEALAGGDRAAIAEVLREVGENSRWLATHAERVRLADAEGMGLAVSLLGIQQALNLGQHRLVLERLGALGDMVRGFGLDALIHLDESARPPEVAAAYALALIASGDATAGMVVLGRAAVKDNAQAQALERRLLPPEALIAHELDGLDDLLVLCDGPAEAGLWQASGARGQTAVIDDALTRLGTEADPQTEAFCAGLARRLSLVLGDAIRLSGARPGPLEALEDQLFSRLCQTLTGVDGLIEELRAVPRPVVMAMGPERLVLPLARLAPEIFARPAILQAMTPGSAEISGLKALPDPAVVAEAGDFDARPLLAGLGALSPSLRPARLLPFSGRRARSQLHLAYEAARHGVAQASSWHSLLMRSVKAQLRELLLAGSARQRALQELLVWAVSDALIAWLNTHPAFPAFGPRSLLDDRFQIALVLGSGHDRLVRQVAQLKATAQALDAALFAVPGHGADRAFRSPGSEAAGIAIRSEFSVTEVLAAVDLAVIADRSCFDLALARADICAVFAADWPDDELARLRSAGVVVIEEEAAAFAQGGPSGERAHV